MEKIKDLFSIRLIQLTIGILFASVVLPSNAKAIAILVFGIAVALFTLKRKWYFNKSLFFTNSLVFLWMLVSVLWSDNIDYAVKRLISMVSLLVFPFIFSLFTAEERAQVFKHHITFLWVFVFGVFFLNAGPFLWYWATLYDIDLMLIHFPVLMEADTGKWSVHPIYLSMFCCVAILFSFYILKTLRNKWAIALLLFVDIVLVLFLLLYAKKGPLIALVIVFSLFIVFQRSKKLLKPYLIAIVTLVILITAIPNTREKFVELYKIESLEKGGVTSSNIRYTIYNSAKTLVFQAPFIGYGVGDYNDVLQNKYKTDGHDLLVQDHYNAHNQYLSFMLIGGIVTLLAFFLLLGVNMVYAIRFDNQLLILLLIFYSIAMLTENILEREAGVVYFGLFVSYFSMFNRELKKNGRIKEIEQEHADDLKQTDAQS